MSNSKKKKYNLIFLPAGKMVEILGPVKNFHYTVLDWHVLSKNRSDLKDILSRIINSHFPLNFYERNEMKPFYGKLKNCHFIFQRAGSVPKSTDTIKAEIE